MACYYPLTAIVVGVRADSGKKVLHICKRKDPKPASHCETLKLPCGNCLGCREDRAKTWAIRCVHEASLYPNNCFITLTYNDEHLPKNGSLEKPYSKKGDRQSNFQLFLKRLRKKYGNGIRYYMCAEYGSQLSRPHYHACLFNFDFPMRSKENPDGKYFWKETSGGVLYRCRALEDLWSDPLTGKSLGFVSVGSVTFDSAAYVARYIVKKINGHLAPDHYQGRQPEYTTMSRRPGIGKDWFKKYSDSDIALAYREGFIVMNGKSYKIPKYYDANFEITDPNQFSQVKETRLEKAKNNPENLPHRLKAREDCHRARHEMRTREYEK